MTHCLLQNMPLTYSVICVPERCVITFFLTFFATYILISFTLIQDRFVVHQYLDHQPDITASMRTILVDWLIEVQENFELFHETLYLAVKLVDLFLQKKEVKREYLQLVGATSMLIASKFEVPAIIPVSDIVGFILSISGTESAPC